MPGANKISIMQKYESRELKDKRIEAEAHLIGFYLVEEKKTDEIVREVRGGSITALGESRAMI